MSLRVGLRAWTVLLAVIALACLSSAGTAAAGTLKPAGSGELDCNGQSTQQTTVNMRMNCTDVRGFDNVWNANTWSGRFYDNGYYIGHDEPDMTFLSDTPGSGDNVTWTETLPVDPSAAPTVMTPGSDVTHMFELTPAPWFSMAMCDPNSYPQSSCKPESDSNAPTCVGNDVTDCYDGGGSAFMEMQLYPPGNPPFIDSTSCDDTHWCAALTIDSLECTKGFVECNTGCEEPVNFAWIQRNGVPTGPASPQLSDVDTETPNSQTLMMNPGDTITIHMFDAAAPGGGHAFEVQIQDLTTGQTGWMQASAHNGFANTSIADCSGTPFNFQPEYSTASRGNDIPWAALQTNISTEVEIGHFEPCTSVTGPHSITFANGFTDTFWNECHGPYEANGNESLEAGDAFCYPVGDTHGAFNSAPDEVSGCQDNYYQNGDLDFDGTSYWADWPVGPAPTATFPGSFVQQLPASDGMQYSQFFLQTDTALSESTCTDNGTGCAIPAPISPGKFYPYWTRVTGSSCTLEFGNVSSGPGVNDLGRDDQYGVDMQKELGYPEFEGPVMSNSCSSTSG
jgi:hypothetical protein